MEPHSISRSQQPTSSRDIQITFDAAIHIQNHCFSPFLDAKKPCRVRARYWGTYGNHWSRMLCSSMVNSTLAPHDVTKVIDDEPDWRTVAPGAGAIWALTAATSISILEMCASCCTKSLARLFGKSRRCWTTSSGTEIASGTTGRRGGT